MRVHSPGGSIFLREMVMAASGNFDVRTPTPSIDAYFVKQSSNHVKFHLDLM